jgi:outer membrane translocation and assembly module TamA
VATSHALAAGLIVLIACHHQPVHRPGEEYLSAVEFEGNHAISAQNLRQGLALERARKLGTVPDPYLVPQDAERITGIYVRAGYLEVDVHSRVEHHGDATTVIFRIDEGPHARLLMVIEGLPQDPQLPESKVRDQLPIKDGQPFVYAVYDKAKEPLLAVVQNAGYAHAELHIVVIVDRDNHEAVVRATYDVGPKCRFGEVTVTGVSGELGDAVANRVTFDPGDQFSEAQLEATRRAIYAMKRFSTVRVRPDLSHGDVVPVDVTVGVGARHALSLGGGFGVDPITYEIRGRAGYSITSWPFPLTDLDIDTRPAYAYLRNGEGYQPRVRALATLSRIDLFAPRITGTVQAGYNYLVVEAYTMYGPLARLGLTSPLGIPQLTGSVGWQLEDFAFRELSSLFTPEMIRELGLDQNERLGEYQQTVTLDLRDNPLEPHFGVWAKLQVNEGTRFALGNQTFLQVEPEVRGYLPVTRDVVLAVRGRVGAILGDIPVSERYYGGGANEQRGFAERMLAPSLFGELNGDWTSVPFGGGGLFETNLEVRAKLGTIKGFGVGGVLFVDAGDVEETFGDINFEYLHWAIGPGLRVFTPIGAFRVDVGVRLNRVGHFEPEPDSRYAFHISIGEAY